MTSTTFWHKNVLTKGVQYNFLNDHMAKWVSFFVDKVLETTQEDFYKGAALILRGIIEGP